MKTIAVIGDVMLDIEAAGCPRDNQEGAAVCTTGTAWRYFPGGAANVASEIEKLGCRAKLFGGIGHDWAGAMLCQITGAHGTLSRCLEATIVKLRARTADGIAARVDLENTEASHQYPFPKKLSCLGTVDAIVFSDYQKGMFGPYCWDAVRELCALGIPTIVDPHPGSEAAMWADCTVATPNKREFEAMGEVCEWTAATLGSDGVAVHHAGEFVVGLDVSERVRGGDVVGAGDAFTAAMAVGLARGETVVRSAAAAMDHATQYVKNPRWRR